MNQLIPISRSRRRRKGITLAVMLGSLLLLNGCRSLYVARLAWEQALYLGRSQPIERVLAEETDIEQRAKLELVLEVRLFAASRGLDPDGSFADLADTAAAASFHIVTAAYADRLEPYTWWYPVVGRVPYRGYFEEESAEKFAEKLRAKNLDVRIVEASAYSTLGWFDDPLPSGVLKADRAEIATVVLHELVHQHYFRPGHVAFNETLANAMGLRMAKAFFLERGDHENADRLDRRHQYWLARSRILDALAIRLKTYFDESRAAKLSNSAMLQGRALLYDKAAEQLDAAGVQRSAKLPMDNASFLAVWRYAHRAELLDAFVERAGASKAGLDALAAVVDAADDPYLALEAEAGARAQ